MEILRRLLLALEQAQSLTDVNIAAGEARQALEDQEADWRSRLDFQKSLVERLREIRP